MVVRYVDATSTLELTGPEQQPDAPGRFDSITISSSANQCVDP